MMAIQHNALDRVASVLASDHQASSDFDLNPDITLPAGRALRDAGVLMLIEEGPTPTNHQKPSFVSVGNRARRVFAARKAGDENLV